MELKTDTVEVRIDAGGNAWVRYCWTYGDHGARSGWITPEPTSSSVLKGWAESPLLSGWRRGTVGDLLVCADFLLEHDK